MDFGYTAGDTDVTIYVRLRDSTTGLAKTGLAFNSAGAVCSYVLPGAARAAITLATQTVTGAHSDGGFVEVDATNCKGLYRLDLPDAAVASGRYSLISIEFDGIIEETVIVPLSLRKSNVKQVSDDATAADTLELFAESLDQATGQIDRGTLGPDTGLQTIRSDTLQAATNNSLQLDAGASSIADYYKGTWILITGGTGAGQVRLCISYNNVNQTATVFPDFETTPNSSSTFAILPAADIMRAREIHGFSQTFGSVQDATPAADGFDTNLTQADNHWNDALLIFSEGTLAGQARVISTYSNASGAVTFDEPFTAAPANGTSFIVLSFHIHTKTQIADAVHDGTLISGTADTGSTTTSIVIKTIDVTGTPVTDQFKGRSILFTKDTTTAALRGQGAPIDGNTGTAITLAAGDALTTAPAADDAWRIV